MRGSPASADPTVSAWSEAQRRSLRIASQATARKRARSDIPATATVLLAVLAKTGPVSFRPGELSGRTGLSALEVQDALADLEELGLVEPGAAHTRRVGILVPQVLTALGLKGFGLGLEQLRSDVEPAGCHVEQTEDDLAEAFGTGAAADV